MPRTLNPHTHTHTQNVLAFFCLLYALLDHTITSRDSQVVELMLQRVPDFVAACFLLFVFFCFVFFLVFSLLKFLLEFGLVIKSGYAFIYSDLSTSALHSVPSSASPYRFLLARRHCCMATSLPLLLLFISFRFSFSIAVLRTSCFMLVHSSIV